jgi:glycosyltransferase involved in cell wall biosynthesis
MRIALVHSFYRSDQPSGENAVVLAQADALSQAGHEVALVARHTDESAAQPFFGIRSAVAVATGIGPDPTAELAEFEPDVVHVHNLFPNFGDRWVTRWPGPVVVTLHNYRTICANGLLFRDGAICTQCPDGDRWAGVRHGCYRGSRTATLPLALATVGGLSANRVLRAASRVIVPSDTARDVLVSAGLPRDGLRVIPAGIAPTGRLIPPPAEERWVAIGRLSGEKGFGDLLRDWPDSVALDVIGAGPDSDRLRAAAGPRVSLHGPLPHDELVARLPGYTGLVFPSKALETQGMAVVEALACGVPVIAREGSAGAGIAAQVSAGWTYRDAESLDGARRAVVSGGLTDRQRARDAFDQHFSLEVWVASLLGVYAEAVG